MKRYRNSYMFIYTERDLLLLVYDIFLAVLQGAVAMTFKLLELGIVLA